VTKSLPSPGWLQKTREAPRRITECLDGAGRLELTVLGKTTIERERGWRKKRRKYWGGRTFERQNMNSLRENLFRGSGHRQHKSLGLNARQ